MNQAREEVRLLVKALRDLTANQAPLPGIYPDYSAPTARVENGQRIIANARWGLPSPAFALNVSAKHLNGRWPNSPIDKALALSEDIFGG